MSHLIGRGAPLPFSGINDLSIQVWHDGARQVAPGQIVLGPEDVGPNTDTFVCIGTALNVAFNMLASQQGRAALEWIFDERNRILLRDAIRFRGDPARPSYYAGKFVEGLRQAPPSIILKYVDRGAYGLTNKCRGVDGCSLDNPHLKDVAFVQLHREFVARVVSAYRNATQNGSDARRRAWTSVYQRGIFSLALTLMHEMIHVYTFWLNGSSVNDGYTTPPNLRSTISSGVHENQGESGRAFEERLFGGVVHFYSRPNTIEGDRHTGYPNIVTDPGRRAHPIAWNEIMRLIRNEAPANYNFNYRSIRDPDPNSTVTPEQRHALGYLTVAYRAGSPHEAAGGRLMASVDRLRRQRGYYISGAELTREAVEPGRSPVTVRDAIRVR